MRICRAQWKECRDRQQRTYESQTEVAESIQGRDKSTWKGRQQVGLGIGVEIKENRYERHQGRASLDLMAFTIFIIGRPAFCHQLLKKLVINPIQQYKRTNYWYMWQRDLQKHTVRKEARHKRPRIAQCRLYETSVSRLKNTGRISGSVVVQDCGWGEG